MSSVTLCGRRVFSPKLGSVIVGGSAEANTAMLSRDRLFARRGLLVLAWLLGGLNVFLSLRVSTLDAVVDTLGEGRTSVSVSHLGRLGLVLRVDIVQKSGGVSSFRLIDSSGWGCAWGRLRLLLQSLGTLYNFCFRVCSLP
jgi:hypothetical protein